MQYPHAIIEDMQRRQLAFAHGLHEAGLSKHSVLDHTFDF